ncbi:ubiquitin related modifier 1 [Nematocida sp. AWRm77]|nr:ubiquitin related modifier 1 [Nematocida sp. AWRm77]
MQVVFLGGLEDNTVSSTVAISAASLAEGTLSDLLLHIEKHVLENDYKYFSTNGKLCGGILCLINEIEAELFLETRSKLEDTDTIHFISTLHGG